MIILITIIALVVFVGFRYNALIKMKEAVNNSFAQISVQLDARGKVFDSLVATVNKVMKQEVELFTEIARLRSGAKSAKESGDIAAQQGFENSLSEIVKSGQISIAVEAYPEMKSSDNMAILQEQIITSENKIASAKTVYNSILEKYKAAIQQLPDVFIVKMIPTLQIDNEYWVLEEEEIKNQESKRISFD